MHAPPQVTLLDERYAPRTRSRAGSSCWCRSGVGNDLGVVETVVDFERRPGRDRRRGRRLRSCDATRVLLPPTWAPAPKRSVTYTNVPLASRPNQTPESEETILARSDRDVVAFDSKRPALVVAAQDDAAIREAGRAETGRGIEWLPSHAAVPPRRWTRV